MTDAIESTAFRNLLTQVGRNDMRGSYSDSREYSRTERKQLQRERVLEFVLSYAPAHVRLLSFPGTDWVFENMLLRERTHSHLVGLENLRSVYLEARRAIPGTSTRHQPYGGPKLFNSSLVDGQVAYGNGLIHYARVRSSIQNWNKTNRSHRLLLMDASTYMSMLTTNYGQSVEQMEVFKLKFGCRNVVWLDFTSQLCPDVESTISEIKQCLEPATENEAEKPIVITILNGRDRFNSEDQRIARILELQKELTYRDHWTYIGKGNSSMLTVCLTHMRLILRRPVPQKPTIYDNCLRGFKW